MIVPTIGRPTLQRALESIEPQPDDEVLVVTRKSSDIWAYCADNDLRYLEYHGESIQGGAMERRFGIEHATGDWLVFLDDDDVMAPNGLEIIREEIGTLERPLPLLFRVQEPGGFIWSQEPSLTHGEVTGSQFVCPRTPVPNWPRDPSGDHPFINATIDLWGGYKPVDRVIIIIRPEQI